MSKVKPPKVKGVANKHLHTRTTFLYQAATYLTMQTVIDNSSDDQSSGPRLQQHSPLALQLGSDLQQVSRKGQLRLSVDLKRSMCKRCNTVLIPGRTATQSVENMSKGGKKPWADVLLIKCQICGSNKRFPIGVKKQLSKSERQVPPIETMSITGSEHIQQSDLAHANGTDQDSTTN
ncbi:RNAse P Rpr2/Rpp21/SNM1 subunit domain-containing protein [Pyrenochaeta sp. MPI-SDFR-AT-0127]|nr:RNAse P Rpr2/Rpp21/SNM1 subunit domain-containing protein [Pyrenochaeta sp. MPI-SDFR-AT-0127]